MIGQLLESIARRGLASGISLAATSYLAHQFASSALGTFLGMLALSQLLVIVCSVGLEISPAYMLRNHPNHAEAHLVDFHGNLSLLPPATRVPIRGNRTFPPRPTLQASVSKQGKLMKVGIGLWLLPQNIAITVPQLACLQGLLRLRSYNVLEVAFPLTFLAVGGYSRLRHLCAHAQADHLLVGWSGRDHSYRRSLHIASGGSGAIRCFKRDPTLARERLPRLQRAVVSCQLHRNPELEAA